MKKHLTLCISLFLLGSSITNAVSNNDYNKAWDAFLNNKNIEARSLFEKAQKDKNIADDALLSAMYVNWVDNKEDDAFKNLFEFYKKSDNPENHLYASFHMPFSFSRRDMQKPKKLEFLKELEKDSRLSGTMASTVRLSLAHHYMKGREFDKANEYYNSSGVLRHWQLLGGFDNTSGGGYKKDWGAVDKPKSSDKFLDNTGAETSWFYPGTNKEDGWYYLNYHLGTANSIIYAQSFVDSPMEQFVYLRIGVSGSVKVWVNDAVQIDEELERNCDMDIYTAKVKLNKGANRILVQLGGSNIQVTNFYLRLTDEDAFPIEGLTDNHEYASYTKDMTRSLAKTLEFQHERNLKKFVEENPTNLVHQITLAEVFLMNDKVDEAIAILKSIQAKYPKSTFLHLRLAEAYTRSYNTTFQTKEIEAIKINDPESFPAIQFLITEAQQSNKIPEVKSLLENLRTKYGENDYTDNIDYWLCIRENNNEKKIEIARARVEKHLGNFYVMSDLYNIEENTLKNSKASKQLLEDYFNTYYDLNAYDLMSRRLMQDGETEKGLDILKERNEIIPYASGYLYQYALTLNRMQRYDEALAISEKVMKLAPYMSSSFKLKADIYKDMKKNDLAIENYKKAFYYSPGDFESLKQLRLLGAEKEAEDYFPKNNLDELIKKAGSPEDYPEDHSLLVMYSEQNLLHKRGTMEERTEMAIKILNRAGIEAWKEYGLSTYRGQNLTLDKAEVIKSNGQKVKAETNGGHIVFTDLEVGDILHLDYRIKTYYYGKLANNFAGSSVFQFLIPSMEINYNLVVPKGTEFQYKALNSNIKPKISEVNGNTSYYWELNNQEAIREEPIMAELLDIVPAIVYSNFPSWEYVREWYQDVTSNKFRSDYLLKETVASILEGKENATDIEKAELFYNYILKTISYLNVAFMQDNQIPQSASRTIATRLGDCKDVSALFVAMCREVGIDANLVLVLTKNNSKNNLALPNNFFNHCIAELNTDNKTYYLELTSNKLAFGSAFDISLHSPMLSINKPKTGEDKLEFIDMDFRPENKVVRISGLIFEDDNFILDANITHHGAFAAYMRDSYADIGLEEQTKILNEQIAKDYRVKTTVSDLKFENLDAPINPLKYSYQLRAENQIQEVAGMKMFKLVWGDDVGSLEELSIVDRKYPLLNWAYNSGDKTEEQINIILPKGSNFVETPSDIALECKNASYSLKYDTSEAGVVKVYREFINKTELVTPDEYEDFARFMREVSKSDTKQYLVK